MAGTDGIPVKIILEFITSIVQLETAIMQRRTAKTQAAEQELVAEDLPGSIRRYFQMLESYLKDMDGRDLESSNSLMQHVKQARKFAFDMEDKAEEFMLQVPHQFHVHNHKITKKLHEEWYSRTNRKKLDKLSSQMAKVFTDIDRANKLKKFITPTLISESAPISYTGQGTSHTYPEAQGEELVGIDERLAQFLDHLSESRSNGFVVSVLGPRGSGKTTLVTKAYEILKKYDFPYHAYITIPFTGMVDTMEMICEALGNPVSQGADATQKLRSYLAMKKYLLVFDGIWSKEDWNSIKNTLPDDSIGSKIIICTSREDIASSCAVPCDRVYRLPVLDSEEGMQLFCLKAFQDTQCPEHLMDLSKSIVRKCEGLPTAIAAIGDSLSREQKRKVQFQKVHDSFGYEMESSRSLSIMGKILQQEYNQLSHNLRSCFLYLCNFPEDCTITHGRLVRLWIAENLIEKTEGLAIEQVADDYLDELVQRNLVYVTRRDYEGRVRSCRVMSLVREFITYQSRRKCFSTVMTNTDKSLIHEARRLSLHSFPTKDLVQLVKEGKESKLDQIRSLMIFVGEASRGATTRSSKQRFADLLQRTRMLDPEGLADHPGLLMLELLRSFKLLRVLDLEELNTQDMEATSFPKPVFKLILLRYLNLRGNTTIDKVPKSIGKLSQLETLDLRGTSVRKLPDTILELRNLLYLLVGNGDCNGVEIPGRIGELSALQKLTLIKARESEGHSLVKQLEKLTELRTLGITDVRLEDGRVLCESIQKMKSISSLSVASTGKEVINLDFPGMTMSDSHMHNLKLVGRLHRIPDWVQSVRSLAKIKLKGSKLEKSPLEALYGLPCLCELVLSDAYTGEKMQVRAGWFQKLKAMEIEEFSELQQIIIMKGAMPQLQKLVLRGCQRLRMAPIGIHQLTKLEELNVLEQRIDKTTGEDLRFVTQLLGQRLPSLIR